MKTNVKVKLICSCILSVMLVGCNNDNNSPTIVIPDDNTPTLPNQPTNATVAGGGIAVYGDVDKDDFSKIMLGNNIEALLLDDYTLNAAYSALGIVLPEPMARAAMVATKEVAVSSKLRSQADSYISLIKNTLENTEGAVVNILTNQTTINAQSAVIRVQLSADFGSSLQNPNAVRNMVLKALNGGMLPEGVIVDNISAKDDKLYVDLSFWQDGDNILLWAGANLAKDEKAVGNRYIDLKTAAGLTSSRVLTIATDKESFVQSSANAGGVDILWSIDASGSMGEEQQNLADGAEQFFTSLNAAGIDYRLAVNTQGNDNNRYSCRTLRQTTTGESFIDSQTSDAFNKWRFLSKPGASDSGTETGFYCVREVDLIAFDRPNAKNLVVFVSDEPENETFNSYRPVSAPNSYVLRDFNNYKQYFEGSGTTYFSIAGTGSVIKPNFTSSIDRNANGDYSCNGNGGSASGGAHFNEIAKLTGGSTASICADSEDWSVMFDRIIETATGLASNFTLQYSPIPSTVKVSVNGQPIARDISHQDGFDLIYGQKGVSLTFYGDSLPEQNDTIVIDYDYVSSQVVQ